MDNNRTDKLIKTISDFKKSSIGLNISIHGKAYSLVSTRVAIARRNLGSSLDIKTTLLYQDDKRVIVQADIFIDEKHMASGLAEELRAASRINNTSALENAETSAAGRALAFLGLLTDGIPSAEEISSALAQQDKKLQTALRELDGVSHLGSYQEWITKHSNLFKKVKDNNPIAYKSFQEQFSKLKTTLETKGVINGRKSN